jgi:hypothetical protein
MRHANIFAALTLVMLAAVTPAYAQGGGFTPPQRLSRPDESSWFPDLAVDPTGRVHVLWGTTANGYETGMHTSSLNGTVWTPAIDVVALPSTGAAARPSLAIGPDGYAHMIIRNDGLMQYERTRVDEIGNPLQRQGRQALTVDAVAYFSALAIGPRGDVHTLITDNPVLADCPNCFRLYHRTLSADRVSWTAPAEVSTGALGAAKPRAVVDQNGGVHAIWESGLGGGLGRVTGQTSIRYARSLDGGRTWEEPRTLSAERDDLARNPAIGIDGSGALVVVWLNTTDDQIYFRASRDAGAAWSAPARIADVTGNYAKYRNALDDYDLAADADGNLHLAMIGQITAQTSAATAQPEQSPLEVIHVVWNGGQWGQPQLIERYANDLPEWVRIEIGLGNQIHVVWNVREQENIFDTDNGRFTVFYSRGETGARRAQPLLLPTVTPVPEPTVTAPPARAATAMPAISTQETEVSVTDMTNEYGSIVIVLLSLIPIGVLAAIWLSRRRR